MSRTNKLRNKHSIQEAIRFLHDDKGNRIGRQKGPKKTTPKHGKKKKKS